MHTMKTVMQAIEASIKNGRTSMPVLTSNQCHSLAWFLNKQVQHQGEPVTLPNEELMREAYQRCRYHAPHIFYAGWNACLDETAKLGPLYPAPADPGEVDQLESIVRGQRNSLDIVAEQVENLQKMLAERDALLCKLREPLDLRAEYDPTYPGYSRPLNDCAEAVNAIDAALSASAEPSAREAEALAAEKALGIERLPAEPGVPVDQRDAFEEWAADNWGKFQGKGNFTKEDV